MAITTTKVRETAGIQVWDIIATADADDNIPIVHGRSSPPIYVDIADRLVLLSKWKHGVNTNGQITLLKGVTGGSGDPGVQCTATLVWSQRHGS